MTGKLSFIYAGSPLIEAATDHGADTLQADSIVDVLRERLEQVEKHGFTPHHDLGHSPLILPMAALGYLETAISGLMGKPARDRREVPAAWPFRDLFNPSDPRTNLVKAAAFLLAAIDRLDNSRQDYEPGAGRPSQGQPTGETATSPGHLKPSATTPSAVAGRGPLGNPSTNVDGLDPYVKCGECGCTEDNACVDADGHGCAWAGPYLCDRCAPSRGA